MPPQTGTLCPNILRKELIANVRNTSCIFYLWSIPANPGRHVVFRKADENSLISAAQSLISALALFGLMHDFMNFIIPRRRPELAFILRGLASPA